MGRGLGGCSRSRSASGSASRAAELSGDAGERSLVYLACHGVHGENVTDVALGSRKGGQRLTLGRLAREHIQVRAPVFINAAIGQNAFLTAAILGVTGLAGAASAPPRPADAGRRPPGQRCDRGDEHCGRCPSRMTLEHALG